MSDAQLYLAIGLPSVVALIGILVNIGYFVTINTRIGSLEVRLDRRIDDASSRLDRRMEVLEIKQDRHFEVIIGKITELETRVAALETKRP